MTITALPDLVHFGLGLVVRGIYAIYTLRQVCITLDNTGSGFVQCPCNFALTVKAKLKTGTTRASYKFLIYYSLA